MEFILIGLIVFGIIIIFGKAILVFFSALGGILSLLVPVAVLVAIIYLFSIFF